MDFDESQKGDIEEVEFRRLDMDGMEEEFKGQIPRNLSSVLDSNT
jgi:hypothetical protein